MVMTSSMGALSTVRANLLQSLRVAREYVLPCSHTFIDHDSRSNVRVTGSPSRATTTPDCNNLTHSSFVRMPEFTSERSPSPKKSGGSRVSAMLVRSKRVVTALSRQAPKRPSATSQLKQDFFRVLPLERVSFSQESSGDNIECGDPMGNICSHQASRRDPSLSLHRDFEPHRENFAEAKRFLLGVPVSTKSGGA